MAAGAPRMMKKAGTGKANPADVVIEKAEVGTTGTAGTTPFPTPKGTFSIEHGVAVNGEA